jgi:SNF2 family DNA or RNA helicase
VIPSRAKAAVKAMAHQTESLKHDKRHEAVFDMSDPGTGKTYVRVVAFATRRRAGGGCLLVLAPKSLLRTAWGNDFARFAPDMRVSVATAANRQEALDADADVYVVNHDGVKDLAKRPPAWFKKFSDLVIDESDAYKTPTSQRSKAVAKLTKHFKRRACLSATPSSNTICDIWHQAYLLDGGKRLGPNFYGFRGTVCIPTQVGRDPNAVRWADKLGAEEAVFGLLADITIRHERKDCVDIPPTQMNIVEYVLPKKQRAIYETMIVSQLLPLLNGGKLTAVNAAAVATKALQICSGAVYDASGGYHLIDDSRYEALMDMASVRKHPLMLFFWKHQRDLLTAEADRRGMKYVVFDGDLSDTDRVAAVAAYQQGAYDLMFGHPRTVAHGLTLTKGTSIIWPGPTYDLGWWVQANARQARIGQTLKTEVVASLATDTIEDKVYDMCMGKDARMSNLLDLFSSMSPKPTATKVARKLAVA